MSNKSLKESIQKSIRENILNEKWSDAIPQAVSGIANMGRNIAGQYSLGSIDKKLQRVGGRIEKDWNSAADEITNKANKLTTSKNQMIAKQGQMTLNKIDNISNQINQAMQVLKTPLDQMSQHSNVDDPLAKLPEEKAFEQWLRNSGGRPQNLNKNEYGKYFQKWRQLRALGLNPVDIPIQDLEKAVAVAAHKRGIELKDLDAELRKGNKYKMGLGSEFVEPGQESEEEDISASVPPPPPKKVQPSAQVGAQDGNRQQFMNLVAKNKAAAQNVPAAPPKGSMRPSYEDAGIPTLDAKMASKGNVVAPKPLPQPPSSSGMQSPPRQKGSASPPPVSHPGIQQPQTTHKPLEIPKGTPAEPDPIPLTKLKPYSQTERPIPLTRPKKQVMEMPPREEKDEMPVVPASIKDMLPPIKDNGNEIQVGSEEKPAVSPRHDEIKPKNKPKKKVSSKKSSNKK